jgi:predicted permease
VLLTIAMFAYQLFRVEFTEGPGFRTVRIAKVTIDTSQAHYSPAQAARFFERVLANARELPEVRAAGATSAMPLWGSLELPSVVPEGFVLPTGQSGIRPWAMSVDESFLDTLEIPLVAGRRFRETDTLDTPRVAIVNETFAERYWRGGDAVGRRFRRNDDPDRPVEIVGIVKTSKYTYFAEPPQEMVYYPFRQQRRGAMTLVVQTAGESASALSPLREMVRRMDADVPVYDVQTIEAFYASRATALGLIATRLIGGMGLMGLALTMVGLYGLVSYAVGRRTRELGIRMAVGASAGRVLVLVLRQGMMPAWCGVAAGLVLSAITTRVLPRLFPVDRPYDDPRGLAVVVPILITVTLVAALIPARRAARVDPTVALRCD